MIGSCLDLASPTRGRVLAAFTAAWAHLASRQETRIIIVIILIITIIISAAQVQKQAQRDLAGGALSEETVGAYFQVHMNKVCDDASSLTCWLCP